MGCGEQVFKNKKWNQLCEIRGFHSEDERNMGLWKVGILPQHYLALQPRRPRLETTDYA
jgi:hypothetical protein